MRYVMCMGELFKVGEKSYRKILQQIAKSEDVDEYLLGKPLGQPTNITDMSPEWAKDLLDRAIAKE